MHLNLTRLACAALLCAASAAPCLAESFASSASTGSSASVGSVSDSIKGSSNSSSPAKTVADGDYRIVKVAALVERPGFMRLRLEAMPGVAGGQGFELELPQLAVERSRLAPGKVIGARQRPFGIEFASAETRQPFFLAVADDWMRELPSHPVSL